MEMNVPRRRSYYDQRAFETQTCKTEKEHIMKTRKILEKMTCTVVLLSGLWLAIPGVASAHCDTLDGPVVMTAKAALEKGDVTPVLKWVKKDDEKEIRDLFQKTMVVRGKGKEAQELADRFFFETLVRIHRAGEGAPYTGLKSEPVEPIIAAADKALESDSADDLVKQVTDAVARGIRERFAHAKATKINADKNIEAGREFVETYVVFTHYVERLHDDASAGGAHHSMKGVTKAEEIEGHQH